MIRTGTFKYVTHARVEHYHRLGWMIVADRRGQVHLHRAILNAPDVRQVDHVNGDGLDNRRANLRLASHAQNMHNQRVRLNSVSGFKGVSYDKDRQKWLARIALNGRTKNLGRFGTSGEAHDAYTQAAGQLHGEFARTV